MQRIKNSAFARVYTQSLFSLAIDPISYVCALAMVFICALRFFLPFFTASGSADLRAFFSSIPYASIFVFPLLAFRLRRFIAEDSIPASPFTKFCALTLSAFTAFLFPLVLLLALPGCVQSFGDIEIGQLVSGYAGICLYGVAASALCISLFALLPLHPAIPLLISALIVTGTNTVHLLSQFVRTGSILSFLIQTLSFSWHFDAAGKGIVDSRDFFFYLFAAFVMLLFATSAEYRRTGRASDRFAVAALCVIVLCGGIASQRLYIRADLTTSRRYSVSKTSRTLCAQLEEPLRITYYRSKELLALYPETQAIAEYLASYAQQSKQITLEIKKVEQGEIQHLQAMGVQGTQIRSTTNTKTEYVTVYSAVVMQYLDSEQILPLVLSTQTLEYDITRRVQELVTGRTRDVYIISGNGLSFTNDMNSNYGYVIPYLERMGFVPHEIPAASITALAQTPLAPGAVLLVLGSQALSTEDAAAIEHLVKSGVPTFIATSPYSVEIADDWSVRKNKNDALIPALRSWGFAFESALVQDLACFPLSLQSQTGTAIEYQTVNYPQWISLSPASASPDGLTLFWASPLTLYGDTEPLLATSQNAWIQAEALSDAAENDLFITNPFLLPKTAREAEKTAQSFVLAATTNAGTIHGYYETGEAKSSVTVVADQYFVDSLMTAYISKNTNGDFRNYDFLAGALLRLQGDTELSALLQKKTAPQSLYKIVDDVQFAKERTRTLVLMFCVLPLAIISLFILVCLHRRNAT